MIRSSLTFILIAICCTPAHANPLVRHAQNYSIDRASDFGFEVSVFNPEQAGKRTRYLLLRQGFEEPAGAKNENEDLVIVQIPVKRVVALSSTYLSSIDAIGESESLVGVSAFRDIHSPRILAHIEKGRIKEVGRGPARNMELLVGLQPEIVFTLARGVSAQDAEPYLDRMGIATGECSAWLEATPLGRAEWIKFFAAFYDKMDVAEAYFKKVEQRYESLVERTSDVEDRPTVMTNIPWGNTWYVPGGNGYAAKLLKDAGANYLWDDNDRTRSLPLDFESAFERGHQAEFWIHTNEITTIEALKAADNRYESFQAVHTGKVYNNDRRTNRHGGNDLWERGVIHPEEILSDLIHIFHPKILPDHQHIYYRKLK